MMKISRHNYEAYLVDYMEGNLTETMRNQVDAFLLANPDIQEELHQFCSFEMEMPKAKPISFQKLKNIPKTHTEVESDYFQNLCIGKVEEVNTIAENQLLQTLIANDVNKRDIYFRYQQTKIRNKSVCFNEKIQLKKEPIIHHVNDMNFDEYCVLNIEGCLDMKGQQALDEYLNQNQNNQSAFDLYQKAVLAPDYKVHFKHKDALKKQHFISEHIKRRFAYVSAIAAMIVFVLMIYNVYELENQNKLSHEVILQQQEIKEPIATSIDKLVVVINSIEASESTMKSKRVAISQESVCNLKSESIGKKKVMLTCIEPIRIFRIECPKCVTYKETLLYIKTDTRNTSLANLGSQISNEAPVNNNDELAWRLAQASITGINKITNAEMALKRKQTNEKKRIGFSSKYFSFSAPIKK